MEMKSVTSSNIAALGHENTTFRVQFTTGAVYEYSNVPESLYLTILNAESIGSTFNKLIKKSPAEYPFKKVS